MGERTVRTHVVAGRAAAITMLATVAKATVAKAKVVLASPAAAVKQGRQRGPTVQERRREEEEAAAAKEATSARTVIKKAAKARSPVLEVKENTDNGIIGKRRGRSIDLLLTGLGAGQTVAMALVLTRPLNAGIERERKKECNVRY